ncbi:MAG: AI-2E family transporter [Lachnospira sp.]
MKRDWNTVFKLGICVFILYLCILYWPSVSHLLLMLYHASMPLLVGCIIAFPLDILASFYEKHYFTKTKNSVIAGSRRPVCVLAAFITLIGVIALISYLVVPQIIDCIQIFVTDLQALAVKLPGLLKNVNIVPEDILSALSGINWQERIEQIIQLLTNGLGSTMNIALTVISSVFSSVVTAFISIIFSIYVLMGKERLKRQFNSLITRYIKEKWNKKLYHVLTVANNSFRRYIIGQCTEAVILGVLCMLGMFIFRLPYAAMIGTLIGFTALIPIAGAYIGAGLGAFMIFMVSPVKAIIFLIFIVVLQQIEGNLIYPRVVGSSIGLPAIWVFAAVTIGGGVMGIMGMLLAVPLTATIYQLLKEDIHKSDTKPDTTSRVS